MNEKKKSKIRFCSEYPDCFHVKEARQQGAKAERELWLIEIDKIIEILQFIKRLDKTNYDYHGEGAKDRNGNLPRRTGARWLTPFEMASEEIRRLEQLCKEKGEEK